MLLFDCFCEDNEYLIKKWNISVKIVARTELDVNVFLHWFDKKSFIILSFFVVLYTFARLMDKE